MNYRKLYWMYLLCTQQKTRLKELRTCQNVPLSTDKWLLNLWSFVVNCGKEIVSGAFSAQTISGKLEKMGKRTVTTKVAGLPGWRASTLRYYFRDYKRKSNQINQTKSIQKSVLSETQRSKIRKNRCFREEIQQIIAQLYHIIAQVQLCHHQPNQALRV